MSGQIDPVVDTASIAAATPLPGRGRGPVGGRWWCAPRFITSVSPTGPSIRLNMPRMFKDRPADDPTW